MPASYRRWYSSQAWKRTSAAVIARDSGVCQLRLPGCTLRADTVDHAVPLLDLHEAGFLTVARFLDPAGLRAACRSCNSRRGAETINSRRRGGPRQVRQSAEAAAVEWAREYEAWQARRLAEAAPRRPQPKIY